MPGPPLAETHQIEQLIQTVEDLRRRVEALERAGTPALFPATAEVAAIGAAQMIPEVSSGMLAALGRLLLGIAGAYFLRAITEAGILAPLTGALAGLAYGAAWLVSTARIATGHRLSVSIHGLAAACIVAPLLWETTVRFHSLTPAASAIVLGLFVVVGQAFAWQRDHAPLAGVTSLTGSVTAIALIIGTLDPVPFAVSLAAAACVVEFAAWRGRALAWRWIIALACDFCAFLLIYLVSRPQGVPEGYASIPLFAVGALLVGLVAIYTSSTALRTLVGGHAVRWFEIFQVATIVVLAIAGGLRISHSSAFFIGAACLLAGAACYLAVFAGLAVKPARNLHAYFTFALLLVLGGCVLLFPAPILALAWSTLGLAGIVFATRSRRNTPAMHGVVYLSAAAFISGLLNHGAVMMTGTGRATLTVGATICAVAAALGYIAILRARRDSAPNAIELVPATILAALLCWSWSGIVVAFLSRFGLDAPFAGTLRTALVATVAIALAWCGRRWNLSELIWILAPWMLFGAGKLIAEEFRQGRSAALFLSLLIYGGTLIALPRLLRRAGMIYSEQQRLRRSC